MPPIAEWNLMLPHWAVTPTGFFFGLLIGSFLNVVVLRLPRMLEQQWSAECGKPVETPPFNLITPRSQCPGCTTTLRWFHNIPLVSYIVLRGRCSSCRQSISLRYPLVELTSGVLFAYCAYRWGISPAGCCWAGFLSVLLALALIDWDTTLLPDDLTQPLLWAGLIAAALQWTPVPLTDALWGAVAGYLSLWCVYQLFKQITGKEGMGYGDFKLLAALGAWLGWTALVPVVLLASLTGALVGLALKARNQLRKGGYVPFGPFLAAAGALVLLLQPVHIGLLGL